jgi:hypothetical protein
MDPVEEAEDTNHIMVVPGSGPAEEPGGGEAAKPPGQKPAKPKMQCEIRPFTKESLEKINLRTANLIRDYGYLPKRAAHLEDGAELPMKFGAFPKHLLGKPVEEIDQFVYEKVRRAALCRCTARLRSNLQDWQLGNITTQIALHCSLFV